MRWVGGGSNIHHCPHKVGGWSLECPLGQNVRSNKSNYVRGNKIAIIKSSTSIFFYETNPIFGAFSFSLFTKFLDLPDLRAGHT